MTNNVRKRAVLKKKKSLVKLPKATKERIILKEFLGRTVLKLLQRLLLDFPYMCL